MQSFKNLAIATAQRANANFFKVCKVENQQELDSESVATAMFPNAPKLGVVRTKTLRTLSTDIGVIPIEDINMNRQEASKRRSDLEDLLNRNVGLGSNKSSDPTLSRHRPFEDGEDGKIRRLLPNGFGPASP